VRVLVDGSAIGPLMVLSAPLSFWGGVNVSTGAIVDVSHPEVGQFITGAILVLPHGRGSSSSATVLAEMTRTGMGPAGLVLAEPDDILVTGAFVANRLYGTSLIIVTDAQVPREPGRYTLDSSGIFRSD